MSWSLVNEIAQWILVIRMAAYVVTTQKSVNNLVEVLSKAGYIKLESGV
mgnify:CR=1 FL=1